MKLSPSKASGTQKRTHGFSAGLGSVLVLLPDMRSKSFARRVLRRSDAAAMESDWQAVGNDLRRAADSACPSSYG